VNILVTGASGFIGSQFVPALVRQGHDVTAVGRRQDVLDGLGSVRAIACDLRTPSVTSRFPRSVDAVVHLARASVATRPSCDALPEVVTTRRASESAHVGASM
jgi:nucleoside-diphosphate-sugar epimerase